MINAKLDKVFYTTNKLHFSFSHISFSWSRLVLDPCWFVLFVLDSCWLVMTCFELVLSRPGLVLIIVDPCWLVWTQADLCWDSCIRIDSIDKNSCQHNTSYSLYLSVDHWVRLSRKMLTYHNLVNLWSWLGNLFFLFFIYSRCIFTIVILYKL